MALTFKQKQETFKSAFKLGNDAEHAFATILSDNYDIDTVHGTTEEDKRGIDFKFIMDKKTYTCDVKAQKKLRRNDSDTNSDLVWLELENSHRHSPYKGWLYHKDTDYFAFQNEGNFYLVRAKDLRYYVHSNIDIDMRPMKTSALKYLSGKERENKVYYRHDYNNSNNNNDGFTYDVMCIVSFKTIKDLSVKVFKKEL